MSERKIAKRYAQALFQHVSDDSISDKVYENCKTMLLFLNDNAVNSYLISPINSRKEKQKLLSVIAEKNNFENKFTSFLNFITDKGRADLTIFIINEYLQFYHTNNGIREAVLESAFEIEQENLRQIQIILEQKTNYKLLIKKTMNHELIGGFRLNIDQEIHDYSIQNQIEKLKKQFIAGN